MTKYNAISNRYLLIHRCLPGLGPKDTPSVVSCFYKTDYHRLSLAGHRHARKPEQQSQYFWPAHLGKYQQKWGESPLSLGSACSKLLALSPKVEYWTQPNTPWNFTAYWTALGKPLSEEGGGKPVPHSVCQFFWWAVGVMQQQDICVRDMLWEVSGEQCCDVFILSIVWQEWAGCRERLVQGAGCCILIYALISVRNWISVLLHWW